MTRTKSNSKLIHRFPALTAGLLLISLLSACGQGDDTDDQQSKAETVKSAIQPMEQKTLLKNY